MKTKQIIIISLIILALITLLFKCGRRATPPQKNTFSKIQPAVSAPASEEHNIQQANNIQNESGQPIPSELSSSVSFPPKPSSSEKNLTEEPVKTEEKTVKVDQMKKKEITDNNQVQISDLIFYPLLLALWGIGPVHSGDRGTTGGDFLKIGLGARAIGMGEAVTAVVDGVEGMFWNAGALSKISKFEATFMRLNYLEGISLNNLAYGQKIKNYGVVGLFIEALTTGEIGKTDIDAYGNLVEQGDSFKAGSLIVGLGYSWQVGKKQGLGATIKGISSSIDTETARGYALDLGWIYDLRENMRLGAAIQNLGTKLKYVGEGDKLPLRIKLGIGHRLIQSPLNKLILGLDVISETGEGRYHLNSGLEYSFREIASVRVGYNTDRVSSLGSKAGFSLGAGLKFSQYSIDYGFVPYGDLGDSHRLSLGAKF